MTLFADVFEKISEPSEELCRPSVETLAGEDCRRHASSLSRWSLPMAADSSGRAKYGREVCKLQPDARRLQVWREGALSACARQPKVLQLWCCELDGSSGAGAQVCAAAEAGGVLYAGSRL